MIRNNLLQIPCLIFSNKISMDSRQPVEALKFYHLGLVSERHGAKNVKSVPLVLISATFNLKSWQKHCLLYNHQVDDQRFPIFRSLLNNPLPIFRLEPHSQWTEKTKKCPLLKTSAVFQLSFCSST